MQNNTDTGNINTGDTGNPTAEGGNEKTFTQDQVNQIVGDRLAKERSKIEADLARREQDLAQREYLHTALEECEKRGFTPKVLELFDVTTVDDLNKKLDLLTKLFPPPELKGVQTASPPKPWSSAPNPNAQIRGAFGLTKG